MRRGFVWSLTLLLVAGSATHIHAGQLALSSLIQYSRVIQGGQDPVYAYVYNQAPAGSTVANYKVYATFPYGTPYSYTGSKIADGGTGYVTLPFTFDSSQVAPGNNIPISVTGIDTDTGGSLTQSGSVTVLAHSAPALVLQGQIVYLTSKATVKFQTSDTIGQTPETGTEAAASYAPNMIGDPPGEPTAELDLDSITSSGSPYITTTLQPFINLPANNDPSQAIPFQLNVDAPGLGVYTTTFGLHYSDEQDLPGAAPPGSELVSFTVSVDMEPGVANWTITAVPEPSSMVQLAVAAACASMWALRRRRKGRLTNRPFPTPAIAPIAP